MFGCVVVWLLDVCNKSIYTCKNTFQAFPFEIDPYQIWGVGVAENMEYSQKLMNGHYRMAIDNLALSR